jgi:hypothetical protein
LAQFILVSNGINGIQFQKAMEVVNKSGGKISLIPQNSQSGSVNSPGMSSNKAGNTEIYNQVRFEWDHTSTDLAIELLTALGK